MQSMEALTATPDAHCSSCNFLDENPSLTARRRRLEIRRLKLLTCSDTDGTMKKRNHRSEAESVCEDSFMDRSKENWASEEGEEGEREKVGLKEEIEGGVIMFCEGSSSLTSSSSWSPKSGCVSVIGRRREMEDVVTVMPGFHTVYVVEESCMHAVPLHYFAVYDGHGGSQASQFCKDRFHEALAEELKGIDCLTIGAGEWSKVMAACFQRMDVDVGGLCRSGVCNDVESESQCESCHDTIAPGNVGSTAVIALVTPLQLVVANCGDSRAVLSRGGKAIPLSSDHRPEREDELRRIEAAGGRVLFWDGYRVGGFLAVSRSIGDRYLKQYVISDPEVTCTERSEDDEFLILASDGLWDVVPNDVACAVVRKCLGTHRRPHHRGKTTRSGVEAAAAMLTNIAMARGSDDNISIVVVNLREGSAPRQVE
ncbi:probable protein phosphatase 2C 8 [Amborella trichopoda]|nr:probable protein phosphatase 2C 8 [Amborella trichopoda]XP_020529255.1 probable protein phosphatase 2C 8 [Amborella trichopoda]XP_020529256.1 probable protein phosphatase 2C 8 [Amborella trichopoda]|eukprot:XP_006854472.2 probable protein phosphatase 2C 8 [Amborella trichopoda]